MAMPMIVFDWDGTLADSMPLCIREVGLALERTGLPPRPEALLRACNGPTHIESLTVLGIPEDKGEEFLRQRLKAEMESIPEVLTLYPGIGEMLRRLSPRAELVIASNGIFPYVDLSARVTGVREVFRRIEASKPGRTKAQAIAEMLRDSAPTRAIMVGDRINDFDAGKQNGLPTVACTYGYGNEAEYALADLRVKTVAALDALLEDFVQGRGAFAEKK